jgi:hypothetical protein
MKIKPSKIVKENFDILKKNTRFSSFVKERKLRKMAKRTIFSRPVFSLRRTLRPLTSLAATLCLASGILIGTVPAYADAGANITVTITKLGNFKCAQVLFGKSPRIGTHPLGQATTDGQTITGTVVGAGMFSVDFYTTPDCSGSRGFAYKRFATTVDASYTCDGNNAPKSLDEVNGPNNNLCQQN